MDGHIHGTGHNHVVGDDLGLAELKHEMRMVLEVAGGETSRLDVDRIIIHSLDLVAMKVAAAFLRPNLVDDAFLGLEVVRHFLRFEFSFALREVGRAMKLPEAVGDTLGGDHIGV